MTLLLPQDHSLLFGGDWKSLDECELGDTTVQTLTLKTRAGSKTKELDIDFVPLSIKGKQEGTLDCVVLVFGDVQIWVPKTANVFTLQNSKLIPIPVTRLTQKTAILLLAFDHAYLLSEPEQLLTAKQYKGNLVAVDSDSPFLYGKRPKEYRSYGFAVCIGG